MCLNTDIWNNEEVFETTQYSMDHLKQCLHDLAAFISSSLSPNRLEAFYTKDILQIENYNKIPSNISLGLNRLQ